MQTHIEPNVTSSNDNLIYASDPSLDYAVLIFNGISLGFTPNVTLEVTLEQKLKPLMWLAAVQDPATMQELILTNKYAQLLLILYDASLANINKLGLTEAACRSLIRRLGLEDSLKREARRIIKDAASKEILKNA